MRLFANAGRALWLAIPAVAVAGCLDHPSREPVPSGDEALSSFRYHPEDDALGGRALAAPRAPEELRARRIEREAARLRSKGVWSARVSRLVSAETAVVIASMRDDLGGVYGARTHTVRATVHEQLAGPAIEATTIEISQAGYHGRPLSCGSLGWPSDGSVAVILRPIAGTHYELAVDGARDLLGWAVQRGPDSFESDEGARVTRSDLVALGEIR